MLQSLGTPVVSASGRKTKGPRRAGKPVKQGGVTAEQRPMEKAQPVATVTPVSLVPGSVLPLWGGLLLFAVWAALFGFTVRELLLGDAVVQRSSGSIGSLVVREGTVQFRPADVAIWTPTARSHRFFEGDMVATGDSSRAVVRFEDGRELEITENSQIALRTEADRSSSQYGAIVTLLRGNLAARAPSPAEGQAVAEAAPLRIVTGDKVFTLSRPDAGLAMERSRGAATPLVKQVQGKVEVKAGETKAFLRQDGDQLALVTENPADQAAADAALGEVITEIKGLESALAPLEHDVYWASSLVPGAAPANELYFELRPPEKKLPKAWAPALRLAAVESPRSVIVGKATAEPQRLGVTVPVLLQEGVPSPEGALAGIEVSLAPGARILNDRTPQSFAKQTAKITFRSASALPDGPMLLQVDRLEVRADEPYLLTESEAPAVETAVQLHFRSGRDFAALAGVLPAAGRFRFQAVDLPYAGEAYYFVRDGRVIGMLTAPPKAQVVDQAAAVARKVHADVLFRGPADAYLAIPKDSYSSGARLRQYVGKASAIYVLSGLKLVRVNSSFIETEASVVDFIARSGSVFAKPVEIISLGRGTK